MGGCTATQPSPSPCHWCITSMALPAAGPALVALWAWAAPALGAAFWALRLALFAVGVSIAWRQIIVKGGSQSAQRPAVQAQVGHRPWHGGRRRCVGRLRGAATCNLNPPSVHLGTPHFACVRPAGPDQCRAAGARCTRRQQRQCQGGAPRSRLACRERALGIDPAGRLVSYNETGSVVSCMLA